jgi:hypothetical protein
LETSIAGLGLPPACKGRGGGYDVGYGVYDWYDPGEFDQRSTTGWAAMPVSSNGRFTLARTV